VMSRLGLYLVEGKAARE